MAAGLIGINIAVTLQHPRNTVVQGTVAAVDSQTSTLTLRDAVFLATGHRLASYAVEGHAIADIKVSPPPVQQHVFPLVERHPPLLPYEPYPGNHAQQSHPGSLGIRGSPAVLPHAAQPVPQAQQPFVDPAILSMGKRSVAPDSASTLGHASSAIALEAPATPIKPLTGAAAAPPLKNPPSVSLAKQQGLRKPSAATLEGPFSSLDIADAEEADTDNRTPQVSVRRTSINKTRTGKPMDEPSPQKLEDGGKKTRRGGKARKKELAAIERRNGGAGDSPEAVRKGKGTGWRSTPMLQDVEQFPTRTPGVIGGRVGLEAAHASNRKTRRQRALEATNGWATEDATDIQDMPEFDFQSNLNKFDKRTVFNQIRNEDTTADEDRLVSFNRVARPGTHGGKNLHPSENVLERHHKSGTNTSSDDSDFGSSRNSRRAMSRASIKRIPTRQGSGVQAELDLTNSGLLSRINRSILPRQYASSHATGSPKPGRIATPPDSPPSTSSRGCLRLATTNRRCNTITPGAMLAVEEAAEVDYGLTEPMLAENAGHGIAEVALTAINPGGRRLARDNPNSRPVIVVLAGNHRSGARAIAAARHLAVRGPKIMLCVLGFERPADWDADVRRQIDIFRRLGGTVRAWPDTADALKRLAAPPELIVDALLGRHREFEALGEADRGSVLEVVGWANKSRAAVLAVECPSGVAGSTGEVAILEGEPLEVRAKYVVCLGAPRTGLLRALQGGSGRADPEWSLWVVDIGVDRVWREVLGSGGGGAGAGTGGGRRRGIKFGEGWVVQVRFMEE